jgi:predicted N-acetyltransferase YhbS
MVRYRTITTIDTEYVQEKELRDRVLRRPLGLTLSSKDLSGENDQVHIVVQDDSGQVIGCVLVVFIGVQAKARQLAVDERWRGKGIGRELMRRAEAAARERKFDRLMLHGRVVSATFFERLGYAVVSEVFTEVTIPHVRLEKRLPAPEAE